jgi:hypothetical protein
MTFVIEDNARGRWATASRWLSVVVVPVASGAAAIAVDSRFAGLDRWSAVMRGQFGSRVFLIEAAFVVIGAPLAGVFSVRRRSADAASVLPAQAAGLLFRAWRLARPLLAGVTMLAATSAVTTLAVGPTIEPVTLATSHAVFWAAALALAALGAVCASVLPEALDAAACALGIALIVGLGLFAFGPVLDAIPRRLLGVALVGNPIVASAAAANIDIFRTEPLYRLSPLAHIQIDYPTPATTFIWYVVVAAALFVGSARSLARRASEPLLERLSA